MIIQESYAPVVIGVNATVTVTAQAIGGFVAITTGTITVVRYDSIGGATSTTIIAALPVSAGVYYPLPFRIGQYGGTVATASGASGTLGIN